MCLTRRLLSPDAIYVSWTFMIIITAQRIDGRGEITHFIGLFCAMPSDQALCDSCLIHPQNERTSTTSGAMGWHQVFRVGNVEVLLHVNLRNVWQSLCRISEELDGPTHGTA